MKKILRNKKGFTLIELIVVIAILAILAAILIPTLLNYIQEANKAKDQANARSMFTEAALTVATDAATYETDGDYTFGDCTAGVVDGAIDTFECTLPTGTYSLADNFAKS